MELNDLQENYGQYQQPMRSEANMRNTNTNDFGTFQQSGQFQFNNPQFQQTRGSQFSASFNSPKNKQNASLQNLSKEELEAIVRGNFPNTFKSKTEIQVQPSQLKFSDRQSQVFNQLTDKQINSSQQINFSPRKTQSHFQEQSGSPLKNYQSNLDTQAATSAIKHYQARNSQIKEELTEVRKQFNDLKSQSAMEIQELKFQLTRLQNIHEKEKQNQQQSWQKEIELLQQENQDYQLQLEQMFKEIDQYKQHLDVEIQDKLMLQRQLDELDIDRQKNMQKSDKEKYEKDTRISTVMQQLDQERKEKQNLLVQVQQFQNDKKILAEQIEGIKIQNSELELENQQLKNQILESQQHLTKENQNMQNELKEQKMRDQMQIQQLKLENQSLQEYNLNANNQIQLYKKEISDIRQEIKELRKVTSITELRKQSHSQSILSARPSSFTQNDKRSQKDLSKKSQIRKRTPSQNQKSKALKKKQSLNSVGKPSSKKGKKSRSNSVKYDASSQDEAYSQRSESFSKKWTKPEDNTLHQFSETYYSQIGSQNPKDIIAAITKAEIELNERNKRYKQLLQQSQENNADLSQIRNELNQLSSEMETISDNLYKLKRKQLQSLKNLY